MPDKVTPELAGAVDEAAADGLIDVVVEVARPREARDDQPGGRADKIARLKTSFEADAAPLEELIRTLGGEVVDKAWINCTIHARVPARAVPELARDASIAALDRPHELTPDRPA